MVLLGLGVAAAFKPWQTLRHTGLQNPWLAAMVVLPWVWWTRHLLPSGMALHVSGSCLLVLMFGWPLAVWSVTLVGLLAGMLEALSPPRVDAYQHLVAGPAVRDLSDLASHLWLNLDAIVAQIAWMGVLPATLSLALGLMLRRWLPLHLFVFILGRGFMVTAVAVSLAGVLSALFERVPASLETSEWLLANWLMGWGEAFSTGMLIAIFVAFKPHWLLTYSDQRYLPPA